MMRGFKGYINFITGIFVFVAFLLLNLTTVEFARQEFLNVFLNSGLMMVCWILIRNAFAEQGLISGQKDQDVKDTKKEHLITSNEIAAYKSDLSIWLNIKNAERLRQKRIAILSGSSLVYSEYFDEDGNYNVNKKVPLPVKEENKKTTKINIRRYKKDCKLLNKARFAYVAPYITEEITAKENLSSKKHLFGVSVKHWKNIKIVSSVSISLALSVMLSFIQPGAKEFTTTSGIILAFELAIMAGSALGFYFSASNFICGEWREGMIQKILIMEEFYRNVVGTITYEKDEEKPDGTIIRGRKIFTKRADYKPLEKPEKDETKGGKPDDERTEFETANHERSTRQGEERRTSECGSTEEEKTVEGRTAEPIRSEEQGY